MPRVIVTTDPSPLSADASVWLDEHVHSVHLSTDHAAAQFVERLAWAISDAEDADGEHAGHRVRSSRRQRRSSSARRSRSQVRVRA
jgi:hypothetical protein